MAPEHEAQPRAFYDHESDAPSRRRRPAADWGVGEDIFDRMPGPRFTRVDRRADHHATQDNRPGEWATAADDAAGRRRGESMTIVIGRDESAPEARRIVVETDDFTAIKPSDVKPRTDTSDFAAVEASDADVEPAHESWSETDTPDFSSTAPNGRRTVKISGHPDRLPVVRTPRPPRTAVERLGTSPDRIAAYAVALGFLLVLIAVLTTGQ
jgi:hypothetical protein